MEEALCVISKWKTCKGWHIGVPVRKVGVQKSRITTVICSQQRALLHHVLKDRFGRTDYQNASIKFIWGQDISSGCDECLRFMINFPKFQQGRHFLNYQTVCINVQQGIVVLESKDMKFGQCSLFRPRLDMRSYLIVFKGFRRKGDRFDFQNASAVNRAQQFSSSLRYIGSDNYYNFRRIQSGRRLRQ